jgi:hypothetical protein
MEIEIKRTYKENATYGEAQVLENHEPVFDFKTLELPWKENQRRISCIPEGEYMVWKMKPTAKRKYEYFWVQDVAERDSILFHPGNYTRQILGCILPGENHTDLDKDGIVDITNTTATLKILTAMMPDKFKLTIKGNGSEKETV